MNLLTYSIVFSLIFFSFGMPNPDKTEDVPKPDRSSRSETVRYRIDPEAGSFVVEASRGGLLWFMGHNHYLAVRKYEGIVEVTPGDLENSSLELTVSADSLEETGEDFSDKEKQIINKEVKEIALESEEYPEITFKSTGVDVEPENGEYEIDIKGDLTLHGIVRPVTIPAIVSIEGEVLRARGEFEINRKNFGVEATSAFYGMVDVQNDIDFKFDITARRIE